MRVQEARCVLARDAAAAILSSMDTAPRDAAAAILSSMDTAPHHISHSNFTKNTLHPHFPRLHCYHQLLSSPALDYLSPLRPKRSKPSRAITCYRAWSQAIKVVVTNRDDKTTPMMPIIRKESFRWLMPKVSQRRLVCKNGECNISRVNIDKRGRRYLADIFTTLVDIKWRWILLVFTMAFTLSWVIFALLWWLIAFSHRDLENYGHESWKPCVQEVYDFPTALLFSIETQQTIGYGTRCMNPNCPHAIMLVMAQSCFGIIIQALMTGLVFAKLSRPKKRAQTLMFSKNAVVCPRDGQLHLLFRVGDMRKSHIVEAQVRALVVSKRITDEGEVLPIYQRALAVGGDGDSGTDGRLFLVWPVIVQHRIDADSPLWEISADDLHFRSGPSAVAPVAHHGGSEGRIGHHHFEIVIILEGIVESTGMTTQARTSYLPHEILWGHRFERLVRFRRDEGIYMVDYARFHHTVPLDCEVPRESARQQAEAASSANNNKSDQDASNGSNAQLEPLTPGSGTSRRSRSREKPASSWMPSKMTRRDSDDSDDDNNNYNDDVVRLNDNYEDDASSSRSESPATAASRTLQLAVGSPSAQRAVTPVIGRRLPSGTVLQELSLAAFDLTDEYSTNLSQSTPMGAPPTVLVQPPSDTSEERRRQRQPTARNHQQFRRSPAAPDAFGRNTAMTAFSRSFAAVGLPSSPLELRR